MLARTGIQSFRGHCLAPRQPGQTAHAQLKSRMGGRNLRHTGAFSCHAVRSSRSNRVVGSAVTAPQRAPHSRAGPIPSESCESQSHSVAPGLAVDGPLRLDPWIVVMWSSLWLAFFFASSPALASALSSPSAPSELLSHDSSIHSLVLMQADASSVVTLLPSETLIQWIQSQLQSAIDLAATSGPAGPIIFAAAYVAASVLLLPGSVLTLAAGYLFGPLQGTAVVSLASTTAAAVAFLIARYLARPLVARRLSSSPAGSRFAAVDRAVAEGGWRVVLLCRLSPLFPFALSNYLFGVTGVGFWQYVAASWVGMLPGTFTYVYLGGAGRATVDAVAGNADVASSLEPAKLALYAVGAVATLLVTREVSKRAGAALEEAAAKGEVEDRGSSS